MHVDDSKCTCHMQKMKECQFCKNYNNSLITGSIELKLSVHIGTHLTMDFHVPQLWWYCMCTFARVISRSEEQLNQLCSNLVQWWGPVQLAWWCASQLGPTLHMNMNMLMRRIDDCSSWVLKNDRTDYIQIWYTDRDQLVGCCEIVSWKHSHTVLHVQGSLSQSLVCGLRPKRCLTCL